MDSLQSNVTESTLSGKLILLGAWLAILIFALCILIFTFRLTGHQKIEYWLGILFLLTAIPLGYLLFTASGLNRPILYYIQVGLMIVFIVVEFLLDYLLKTDFRHTRWMTISYVTIFFAATGGMIGIASLAGKSWTIVSIILFLSMTVLAFYQRAKTGL
jgi:hypothetical protein